MVHSKQSHLSKPTAKLVFRSNSRHLSDEEQQVLDVYKCRRRTNNKEVGLKTPFRRRSAIWFCGLWVSSAVLFSGCVHLSDDPTALFKGQSAGALYRTAETEFEQSNYEQAIKVYEALEILHPFSSYSENAFAHLIESYYHKRELSNVVSAAQKFIHLYPANAHIETIYYLKALAHFHQERGFFPRFIKVDLSYRDPSEMWLAYQAFSELIHLFPESVYVTDAKQYMIEIRELIAQHDLHIAQFYLHKKVYIAAFNRASALIETYPESTVLNEAKAIQTAAKHALELS